MSFSEIDAAWMFYVLVLFESVSSSGCRILLKSDGVEVASVKSLFVKGNSENKTFIFCREPAGGGLYLI